MGAKKIVNETRERRKSGLLDSPKTKQKQNIKSEVPMLRDYDSPINSKKQRPINKNLMFATFRKKKKSNQFDSARSRRGSSFVDDYNVNDTLFFDGEEANQAVSDDEDELAMDVAVDVVDD